MSDVLECPCCGDVGATSDAAGMFTDGQKLECGCPGHVSCDGEECFVQIDDTVECKAHE